MNNYTARNFNCDILILGAGPAGLAAASTLAKEDKDLNILLFDDNPNYGGQIWRHGAQPLKYQEAAAYLNDLKAASNVKMFSNCKIVAFLEGKLLYEGLNEYGVIEYSKLILCSGAREKLYPFPGWQLPGVTGAGGLQALLKNGLPLTDEKIVIAGTGPLLLAVADTVRQTSANLLGIYEQASWSQLGKFGINLIRWPNKIKQAFGLLNEFNYHPNSYILEALGTEKLEAVRLKVGNKEVTLECDRLACGFSLTSNIEIAKLLGCNINAKQHVEVDFYQKTSMENIWAAGECTGIGGNEKAQVEGKIAALAAIDKLTETSALFSERNKWHNFSKLLADIFVIRPEIKNLAQNDTIFCRCEDVTFKEIKEFKHWTKAKMYSRCGMGACQGKICSRIAQDILGWDGPPIQRMPLTPVRLETLAYANLLTGNES